MKSHPIYLIAILLMLLLARAQATTFYVDVNGANPTPPYSDWSTASTDIQSAIDASTDGDLILVTNGTYQTGGRVVYGALTNRVVVDKAVTVQSVNGPEVTVIQGYQVPGLLVGDGAIRCVYLTNSAALTGFTLFGGATRQTGDMTNEGSGGGVFCESTNVLISNCIVSSNACSRNGAGVYSGTFTSCQIINNKDYSGFGGGAAYSTLFDCTLSGNIRARSGGGAYSCYLSNSVISGNSPDGVASCVLDYCTIENNTNGGGIGTYGGGANQSTLNHCIIRNNRAYDAGGAYQCELDFCTVSNNWATNNGGGVYVVANSTDRNGSNNQITGNWAGFYGGGLYGDGSTNSDFSGWIFTSNSAGRDGGGMYRTRPVNNCVLIGNSAGGNGGGLCRPSGAYVAVTNCTFVGNVASGDGGGAYYAALENCFMVGNQAGGNGGGVYGIANNCVINSNSASIAGGGICSYITGIVPTINHCTFTNNLASRGGGASISFGANTIFTNCVFFANYAITNGGGAYGETLKSCLIISNQAKFGGGGCLGTYFDCTFIGNMASDSGGGVYSLSAVFPLATNCTFTANHATTSGGGVYGSNFGGVNRCSLMGNSAGSNGGGVYGSPLWNCLLSGNSAVNGGGVYNCTLSYSVLTANNAGANGGGAYGSTLNLCMVSGNSAITNGGGCYNSSLGNSLVNANTAAYGGGFYGVNKIYNSTLANNTADILGGGIYFPSPTANVNNSIVFYNSAPNGANYSGSAYFTYCSTVPLPVSGNNNITNGPVFVNLAAENFRLQTNSPCINTGNFILNGPNPTDLDGRPRIAFGQIDMGTYEFQGPGMGEFIGWLQQYGLPTDGSADYLDSDNDRMNNWQEWVAGTVPTNAASLLQLASLSNSVFGLTLTWQSVSTRTYFLQSSTNLSATPPFYSFQSNLVGQAGVTTFTDTSATNGGPYFYRVGVQ